MVKSIYFLVLDFTLRGGVERYVSNMAYILVNKNYNVKIYSFHKSFDSPLYNLPKNINIIYLTKIPFKPFLYKIVTLICCFKLIFINKNKLPNIIYISTSPIIVIFLGIFNPSILKYVIATEHSTYNAHNAFVRKLRVWAYRKILKVVTQTTNGLINFQKNNISCELIQNPVTDFQDNNQWKKIKKDINSNYFTCLTVARFDKVKQLDHIVEIANLLKNLMPNIRFIIVGSGNTENELKSLAKNYNLGNIIEFHKPSKNINDYYLKADLFLITSSSEAFPMTILEALSYGVPVISYDKLVGPNEMIINGYNGYLIEQNNIEKFSIKILEYYNDKKIHEIVERNAIESCKKFSSEQIFQKWRKILCD